MPSTSTPKRIMRIRLYGSMDAGVPVEQLWDELVLRSKAFHLSRFLDAEIVLITDTNDRVLFTVTPTGIDLVDGHRKMRGSVNAESEWVGYQDPIATTSKHNMAYNFER